MTNNPEALEGLSPLQDRKAIVDATTWVVKVGSRSLTDNDGRLDLDQVANLAKQLVALSGTGRQVLLVSSGAVASGMGKLGLMSRPSDLATLQAVAAIGQAHLIQVYEKTFAAHSKHAAQILLTANTLSRLLELGAIPIINENDTVAVDELKTTFGDNDRLAGMVAGLMPDSALVILSDVHGLYDRDPQSPGAMVLSTVAKIDQSVEELVRDRKTGISKGGMASKLTTAKFLTHSGQATLIAWGREPDVLVRLARGEQLGTLFLPQPKSLVSRKRWIGFSTQTAGSIGVDDGASAAIKRGGCSLLAIGVREVSGEFGKGDIISVLDSGGNEIARGLSNYNAMQIKMIRGCHSDRIEQILGQCPYQEVIHRDNLTVL
jgi:glutamate 5-kinase